MSQNKPIPLNTLDVFSNWMYGEVQPGAEKAPTFRVQVIKNVPRFTVKTNIPNDKDHGRIEFNCDMPTFAVIMKTITDLANGVGSGGRFQYNDHIFMNNQRSEKPLTKATLLVGKDPKTGKLFIAILGYNRPNIQFFFGPSRFHKLLKSDGSEYTEAEVSVQYAHGFVTSFAPVVYNLLVSQFDDTAKNVPKPFVPGEGGNNKPKQNNYQSKQSDSVDRFDSEGFESFDDINF